MLALEVRQPGLAPQLVDVGSGVEIGRDAEGVLLDDPKVSRRHVRVEPRPAGVAVIDLGSRNGTIVNGIQLNAEVVVGNGAVIRVGDTELIVRAQPVDQVGGGRRAELDRLSARTTSAAVVRYLPGTVGERAAPAMAGALRRARRRLSGFGSEPRGVRPDVCLVDPFPDPNRPGELVTSGSLVDATRDEIWMVASAESPPEPPERPLARYFGSALPASEELGPLLEGYGLWLAGMEDPGPQLQDLTLPPLRAAEGELQVAMALSFVAFVIRKNSERDLVRFLTTAQPGNVDAAAAEVLGSPISELEERWRQDLSGMTDDVPAREFLRLSMRYTRPLLLRQIELFVYLLLGLTFNVVFPFVTRQIFDDAIPSGKYSEVVKLLLIVGGALVVSSIANLRRAYVSAFISGTIVRRMRAEMFDRLQRLPLGWFTSRQQGEVLARLLSDVGLVEAGMTQAIREGLFQALALVVSVIVLMQLNFELTLIVLLAVPLVAVVYRLMARGARRRSLAVQEETGRLAGIAAENYNAQSVVKAFELESRELDRFDRASDRLFRRQLRLNLFAGTFGLSVNGIVTVLRLAVLALGSWLILQGHFTVGGLVAFLTLTGEVVSPVTSLSDLGQRIQAASGALVRVNEVLNAPQPDESGHSGLPPLSREIALRDVTFSYTPGQPVLEEVSLAIPAGTKVAFVGATGAGKSSVLQLLLRFSEPDQGTIEFDGRDIRSADAASLRGQMGVVFQDTFLFNSSIGDNIALGRAGATTAEVEAAARAAELHDFIISLPAGYDTLVGERGARLSGGQRQRLALARALIRNPSVLLLDEATSALDPQTERLVAEAIDQVSSGRTVIAVTHRLPSIAGYDHIYVLHAGRVVEHGTHEALLAAKGTYAKLWAEQMGARARGGAEVDIKAVLAQLPMFASLPIDVIEQLVDRLIRTELPVGAGVREGQGRLYIVERGRAAVFARQESGTPVRIAELGPGQAFGVSALMGDERGRVLQAVEPTSLLVLDAAIERQAEATARPQDPARSGRGPPPNRNRSGVSDWPACSSLVKPSMASMLVEPSE